MKLRHPARALGRAMAMAGVLAIGSAIPGPALFGSERGAVAGKVDFAREIRPILSANCFACHGPDDTKRKGGLRLDVRGETLKEAKSGARALVPGDTGASELIRRVLSTDAEEVMPPPKTGKKLTPAQVDLLKRWVAQGGDYSAHWAYVPPRRPELPRVERQDWARTGIDYFVLSRLETEGLKPSPEAARETLIRRLSLDLVGIPPSTEEVEEFVRDRSPDAYGRVVERLLGSPHYGERWARPWLDIARYADSNGYEADNRRSIWPYRDWVIAAFNRDLPFDRFTLEQLAGDLLPGAGREQRIATGFHRNTMVNTEGGTDDEEFRVAAVVDRVNTTFEVWMGSTFGCAQCHNHKYDPFSQKEYYQVFAFFNQTRDGGRNNDPQLELPTAEQQRIREELQAKIAPLEKQLATQTPELEAAQVRWERQVREDRDSVQRGWRVLVPERFEASGGVVLEAQPDGSLLSGGALPDNSTYEVRAVPAAGLYSALRVEALVDARLPEGSSGRAEEGDFVLTEFEVELLDAKGGATKLGFDVAYADFSMERYGVEAAVDGKEKTGWAIAAHDATNRVNREAVFVLKEPLRIEPESALRVRLRHDSDRRKHLLGRFRMSLSSGPGVLHREWAKLPGSVRRILAQPAASVTEAQRGEVASYRRSLDPGLEPVRREVARLRESMPKNVPSTLVMESVEKPRATQILIRGSHLNKGEGVEAGVPASLHRFPESAPRDRLGFAQWLVSPDNPLVGRVTMNRIWAAYFGIGLVETSEEFGAQGELPSHPELLDWLATELVRNDWSLKAMHRVIVMSATYRQDSAVSPTLVERDPYNRLLARGPRFRMEAEMLRDTALAAAGLLHRRLGGPSVFPFQPEGVWNSPYNNERWVPSPGPDRFRRGLYTFWRRTAPYAAFMAFDAPSREVTCERRPRSNTPVQALVTLNDPAFLAAATQLAQEVAREPAVGEAVRLDRLFRRCLSRSPRPEEQRVLLGLLATSRQRLSSDPTAAAKLAGSSEQGTASASGEVAAWVVVANAVMNLDEFLTKG